MMSKIEAKFHTFDIPVNSLGRDGKNAERDDRVDPMREPVVYIDGRLLRGLED